LLWAVEQSAEDLQDQLHEVVRLDARVQRQDLIDGADHAWSTLDKAPLDAVAIVLTDIGETISLGESAKITTISMTWPDFFSRTCGRVPSDDPNWRSRVQIDGDFDLAARLLSGIAVTP
jgi:hypothetical protein